MARAMTTNSLSLLATSPRLPLIAALAVKFAYVVTVWEDRRRGRMALHELDNHLLNDIGLTRREARIEAQRPFWQP